MNARSNEHEQIDPRIDPRIDPQLEALLDEALSAESVSGGVPQGLAERISQRTSAALRAAANEQAGSALTGDRSGQLRGKPAATGIIARIGPARVRALAASIVLAASIGVVIAATMIVRDAHNISTVGQDLRDLAQYEPPADPIGQELALLDMQLELALNDRGWAETQYLIDDDLTSLEWQVGTVETGSEF